MLTVGSLFSGIGGLDLGLERAGMQVRWQVEISPFCQQRLREQWPGIKRFWDIRELIGDELEGVDLICGGFPCQPFSSAGKRNGVSDSRWLWPDFLRIIRKVEPRYVLAENVPGLLSIDNGRIFGSILADLASSGYSVEWDCIPAAALGAPHRRDRVFIVAYPERSGFSRPSVSVFRRRPFEKGLDSGRPGQAMADPESSECQRPSDSRSRGIGPSDGSSLGANWAFEPSVGRVADGVPDRMDRLKALGNAVVPQVAEYLGQLIIEREGAIV
jgi:DNA (cytosine-5)-methyltransferase 1